MTLHPGGFCVACGVGHCSGSLSAWPFMPRCWLFPVASAWHILARNGPPICSWGNTISCILSPLCHLPAKDYVNLLSGHLGLGPGLSASQSGSLIWTSGPAWHSAVTSQQEQWPSGCWVATHNRATLPGTTTRRQLLL